MSPTGSWIPFTIVSWTWTPAVPNLAGSTDLAPCVTGQILQLFYDCKFIARESGRLTVRVKVNGGDEQLADLDIVVDEVVNMTCPSDQGIRGQGTVSCHASVPAGTGQFQVTSWVFTGPISLRTVSFRTARM